ncbi:Anthranilate synthase component I [Bacillus cytotoxicus]|uniref:Anthranilate synthase component I n=1 Tax=Bacillus cytotoxicus TaxID=580165 RepID=A0AAX2CEC6_9BACI|nr:Anthranilate synthase component I [Bacillus cytotoxicus]
MMTKEEFMRKQRQECPFFVIEEAEGDCMTPISLYRRMKGDKKFLLESSQLHQDKGRYSYLGGKAIEDK